MAMAINKEVRGMAMASHTLGMSKVAQFFDRIGDHLDQQDEFLAEAMEALRRTKYERDTYRKKLEELLINSNPRIVMSVDAPEEGSP